MRALKSHAKILGLTATLLAGVVLVSVGDAAAKGMGGMGGMHGSMGNGRSPAFGNTMKSGNPGSGTSKPGKTYGHKHDRDKDRAERKREREERKAERKREHCKSGTCEKKWGGNPPQGTSTGGSKPPVIGTTGAPVATLPSGPGSSPGKNPDPGYNGPPASPPKGAGGNPNDPHGTGSTSLKQD